jgi:hypothetical protein
LKAALSKGLGLGIITGSLLGKSPDIIFLSKNCRIIFLIITLQSRYHVDFETLPRQKWRRFDYGFSPNGTLCNSW